MFVDLIELDLPAGVLAFLALFCTFSLTNAMHAFLASSLCLCFTVNLCCAKTLLLLLASALDAGVIVLLLGTICSMDRAYCHSLCLW